MRRPSNRNVATPVGERRPTGYALRVGSMALIATMACGVQTLDPVPFEPGDYVLERDPGFPPGLASAAVTLTGLEAAARVLYAAAWQAAEVAGVDLALEAERTARAAAEALDDGDLATALAALETLTELAATDSPAGSERPWASLRSAVELSASLLALPEVPVVYLGDRLPDGGRLQLTPEDGAATGLVFVDGGSPRLKEGEEDKVRYRPWLRAARPGGGGVVDGQCGKLIDLELVDGNEYSGLSVWLRYYYDPAVCKKVTWVQLVKRTTTIAGKASPAHSKDWSIDVVPPGDVPPADRDEWKTANPEYQKQKDLPHPKGKGRALKDDPGLAKRPGGPRIVTTYQFKSFVICCDPFAVIARVEWGFTLETGGGQPTQVTEMTTDPDDAGRSFPDYTDPGADDTQLNDLLGDWLADPDRQCG